VEAWTHGIVVMCCDGIERHFYLRIFTHSGDYPEKYELYSAREVQAHAFLQNFVGKYSQFRWLSMPPVSHSVIPCTQPWHG
jgi:hypothetical protein